MTNTYLTGNALGSTAPKDLFDNTSNFDEGMNSTSPSFDDRFGKRRLTWAGAEYEWQQLMANSGLELPPLTYVDGAPLTVVRASQAIQRAGMLYRVKLPASFPVTLTGTWATDQNSLVFVSDGALRGQLANFASDTLGSNLVARTTVVVSSVAKLGTVPTLMGQEAVTQSYNPGGSVGGAEYIFLSGVAKSAHDGVMTISPTVPYTTRDAFLAGTGETDPSGSGCWRLKLGGSQLTVAHAGAYGNLSASDLTAINKALASAAANGIGAVRLFGDHAVNDSVRIPSFTTLWGPKDTSIQAMSAWANTGERRIITNADWSAGNESPICAGFTVVGRVSGGSEFDHGVHYGLTTNAGILDMTIRDCQGDGICLGNFVGGVPALCVNTKIRSPVISNVRRQGIAMTCAEGTSITDPYIFNLTAAISGAGVAIDFEPDASNEPVRNNKVRGGYVRNVKVGAVFSSVATPIPANTAGNSIVGMTIDGTSGNGVLCAFWDSEIANNTFLNIGQHAVIVTSSAGVQGVSIAENRIMSAGIETPNNYHGVFLDAGVAHCNVVDNIISATALALTIKTDTSAGFHSVTGNNTRASGRPKALASTDSVGHNPTSASAEANLHEGFTATSRIHLENFGFSIGGTPVYPVTDVPSNAIGADGDVAFNTSATGALWYKKISGSWVAQ